MSLTEERLCRHCGLRWASQARKLCQPCYRKTDIRDLYPPLTQAERNAILAKACNVDTHNNRHGNLDCRRTHYAPGSEQKLSILEYRLSQGMKLWNDEDAKTWEDGDGEPLASALLGHQEHYG